MNKFIEIYQKHKFEIESFLINTLTENDFTYKENKESQYYIFFKNFPSIELIYITDSNYQQISPNISRKNIDHDAKKHDRSYLNFKLIEKDDSYAISEPYLSSATGDVCITVRKKEASQYIFIDFSVDGLLGRFGLIELHPAFNNFTKYFYSFIGFSLIFFTFLAMVYAFYSFGKSFILEGFIIDTFFKPIISITLGLAIFDLGKTILEREVFFKSYGEKNEDATILTKFSVAIIIALSIEALMVVFKITLHDYTQMIHALYLISGIGIILVSLGIYTFLTKKV